MKKYFLAFIAVAGIATASQAQIAIAPELGLNMANMVSKPSSSTSMKAGLTVGAIVDVGFTDNLSLQPGVFYMMNGANFSGGSYSVNTIEIPINVEYKLGKPGGNRLFFGVGPYLGYNVGGTVKIGSASSSMDVGSDSTDDIKALDLGIGINVGYQLKNNFYARVRYQMGLANMQPQGDANNSLKSSALGVTVGYYFGGKHAKKGMKK